MCKKKEKIKPDPNEIINRSSKGFRCSGILSIILWALFVLSVALKFCCNKGIFSLIFFQLAKVELHHWAFFNPRALLEVAKTIGVFSLFIVWIYAELGKSELGKRYSELLSIFCINYHLRAFSYILAILACIYIATIGILESAGIAIIIAAVGLWDQVSVLVRFIFSPSVRKELAIKKWEETFDGELSNKKQSTSISLTNLYALIDNISVKDEYFDVLCKCLAKGILVHTLNDTEIVEFNKAKINSISHIWERLLDGRPYHEQHLIEHIVLAETHHVLNDGEQQAEQQRILVCAGYLQRQIRHYTKAVHSDTDNDKDILNCILSDIDHIRHKQIADNDKGIAIASSLEMLYALLCWMHFLCNNITLSQELLNFLSYYEPVYNDSFKECFRTYILCTFDDNTCNNKFDIAWNQVRKSQP